MTLATFQPAVAWSRLWAACRHWSPGAQRRWSGWLKETSAWEPRLRASSGLELERQSSSLKYRARARRSGRRILAEAFALVREAARRTIGLRHFDVQLLGGLAMCRRSVAEMQTGEGKTLTATLPLYYYALRGKGAHLATVNDYLARRDADLMRPVFQLLGISVGVIESAMSPDARRQAYACDVTYGTAKEFGFDYLRDRLLDRQPGQTSADRLAASRDRRLPQGAKPVTRAPFFALVDEADSVLIDDAGTPLIIGAAADDPQQLAARCRFCAASVSQLREERHFVLDPRQRTAELNATGRMRMRSWLLPKELGHVTWPVLYEDIERALVVQHFYHRDRQYVVRDGEIVIVDEFTGRIAEGRKWQRGIHQAAEAKEELNITADGGQAARVTVQDFFLRYPHLAGMSGTVMSSRRELRRIYRLHAKAIATNRPPIRRWLPEVVFATAEEKWRAIAREVEQMRWTGRPVLVGTRSIDKSEHLSRLLAAAGVQHQVLNAHQIAAEADIVTQAGEQARVTVATNMAGRGTDIALGTGVKELGGMHVICSELHDSPRIDRQLIGRCGRQGDPGSYRLYLALDDEILLRGLGAEAAERLKLAGSAKADLSGWVRLFRKAQRRIERQNFQQRQAMLFHEKQWQKTHRQMGLDPHLDVFE